MQSAGVTVNNKHINTTRIRSCMLSFDNNSYAIEMLLKCNCSVKFVACSNSTREYDWSFTQTKSMQLSDSSKNVRKFLTTINHILSIPPWISISVVSGSFKCEVLINPNASATLQYYHLKYTFMYEIQTLFSYEVIIWALAILCVRAACSKTMGEFYLLHSRERYISCEKWRVVYKRSDERVVGAT